jgi:hypothetical protein
MREPITPIGPSERFSMHTLREAEDLARDHPEHLTDLHLRHCATYDPLLAQRWQHRRARAIAKAAAKANMPPPAPRPAIPADVARLPTFDEDDDPGTPEGLDAWVKKNAARAVPMAIWGGFVKAAREKRQALETRVNELEAKVRELDAQRALLTGETRHLDTDPVIQ